MSNKNTNKQANNKPAEIRYDGMNDCINYSVLLKVANVMLECDQDWYATFFSEDQNNPDHPYIYLGLEPMLNFYKTFKTGELSWQVNEDEWKKEKDISAKCRRQMHQYFLFAYNEHLDWHPTEADQTLIQNLFVDLLNKMYNKIITSGGHSSPISIGGFRKDMNKGSGILWTDEDIDWDRYHATVEKFAERNKIVIDIAMKLRQYMVTNKLLVTVKA